MRSCSRINLACLVVTALCAPALDAQQAPRDENPLRRLELTSSRLALTQPIAPYRELGGTLSPDVAAGWEAFRAAEKGWEANVDRRNGFVVSASGTGIPWGERGRAADLTSLEVSARTFLGRAAKFLGVDPATLRISRTRSLTASSQVFSSTSTSLPTAHPSRERGSCSGSITAI